MHTQLLTWRPEGLLITLTNGASELGLVFNVNAPYAACALCGAVYQSDLDRAVVDPFNAPPQLWGLLYEDAAFDRRARWRELHTRRYHTTNEVNAFEKWRQETGFAFSPEAANKLAEFGIVSNHINDELHAALLAANPYPIEDADGT